MLRLPALFGPFADPARVWRGDTAYDAVNVTDEMQESILLVSTRIHRDNLVLLIAHEGQFWLGARGRLDPFKGNFATRLMSLAVIGASTICVPTARAMMHDDGLLLDSLWLRRDVAPLVRNPALEDGLAKAEKRRDDVNIHDAAVTKVPRPACALGDSETFKSGYAGACHRAKLCSAPVGKPGWPQGFRPDAWRQPLAEVEFLRSCCRYVRYDEKHVPARDRWNRIAAASGPVIGPPKTAIDVRTGLPRQHMLERVQDLFRPWFDRLQVAEETKGAEGSDAWLRREALIREIVLLLPALSAITDDPYLNERFWVDRTAAKVKIAVQGAWQT